ncbi:Leucine-rich repeat receptor-like tyrosine-protein kinase PXC3-like protein [Drosera capensis]
MLSLFVVNFLDNRFSGPIPNLVLLQKSSSSSFTGNKGLCGRPLSSPCNGDDQENYSRKVSYRAVATVLGSGIAVFVSVSIVVLLFMIREMRKKAAQEARTMEEAYDAQPPITTCNVFVENLRQAIDFDAVVKATFKDSNKINSGTFSVVYKATMPSGLTLLFDDEPDWLRRLSIAIGVGEGLAFLHSVAVIHLDVFPGNILLDANFRPLVAEIEMSKLLDPSRGTASISAVAGSFGYIAPAPGNVYSYGVILLEILTTRLPIDEAFGEGSDLVLWVHNAPSREETPEQILDAALSTVSFAWRK